MKQRLETQVATAVGAMLVGRAEITLDEVISDMPTHISAAGPSPRSMTKALVGAGWIAERRDGGSIVYVAPGNETPPLGHNSAGVAADEVRLLIERVERLREERKGISDDINDVFAEAKSRGYDVPSLKGVLRIRGKKKEEQHEEQALLEVYMRALGMMS